MKISPFRLASLAFLCGASLLQADILLLKNGTKVEGTILEQSEQGVRMRYRLTPKIMDDKLFPAGDIAQVIKQRPEEVEVVELRKVLPTPDLMKADEYEQIIQDRLRPFINKYPGTPEAKEVEDLVAKLQEEKTLVTNGQIKLEGKWLTERESKGEGFNVEAFRILTTMRKKAAGGDLIGALREYDKLQFPPPAYRGTSYFIQAIPEVIAILEKWVTALDKMSAEQPQLTQARKEGLSKLQEPELSKTKNAINDELAKWRAAVDAERRQRIRWTSPYKYDLATITSAQKEAVSEITKLQNLDLDALRQQNEVFTSCYRKIGEEDYTGAASIYEKASQLQVSIEYRDVIYDLRNRLLKLHAKLSRAIATGATANAGSTALGGTQSKGVDSRVAEILAQAGAATPATAAQQQPAAASGMQPVTAAPATAAPATAAPATAAPATAAPVTAAPVAAQAAAQQVSAPATMPPPAPMPVEEESNLQLYVMIGMGVLIVVLLLAFLKKK